MVPQWLYNKTVCCYDLETDYIPTSQIFCNGISVISFDSEGIPSVVPSKVYTQYWTPYSNGSLMQAVSVINSCDFNIAHNGISFDELEIKRHLGVTLTSKTLDTLIISKLMFSKDELMSMDPRLGVDKNIWGRYSLKAWGQRMGDFKLDYDDFSHLNKEMTIYCNQDVDLTVSLFLHLLEQDFFPLQNVIELEHKTAEIIAQQVKHGFYIDIVKARELNTSLLQEKGEISREVLEIFLPKFLKQGKPLKYGRASKVKKYLPNPGYKGW